MGLRSSQQWTLSICWLWWPVLVVWMTLRCSCFGQRTCVQCEAILCDVPLLIVRYRQGRPDVPPTMDTPPPQGDDHRGWLGHLVVGWACLFLFFHCHKIAWMLSVSEGHRTRSCLEHCFSCSTVIIFTLCESLFCGLAVVQEKKCFGRGTGRWRWHFTFARISRVFVVTVWGTSTSVHKNCSVHATWIFAHLQSVRWRSYCPPVSM